MRTFLGIAPEAVTAYVREEPKSGHKDWNEQLLAEIEMEKSRTASKSEATFQPKDEINQEYHTYIHR